MRIFSPIGKKNETSLQPESNEAIMFIIEIELSVMMKRQTDDDSITLDSYTVVGKCENVILILIRHETYVNMSGFSDKSKSHSNFSFLIRALGDIYIFV